MYFSQPFPQIKLLNGKSLPYISVQWLKDEAAMIRHSIMAGRLTGIAEEDIQAVYQPRLTHLIDRFKEVIRRKGDEEDMKGAFVMTEGLYRPLGVNYAESPLRFDGDGCGTRSPGNKGLVDLMLRLEAIRAVQRREEERRNYFLSGRLLPNCSVETKEVFEYAETVLSFQSSSLDDLSEHHAIHTNGTSAGIMKEAERSTRKQEMAEEILHEANHMLDAARLVRKRIDQVAQANRDAGVKVSDSLEFRCLSDLRQRLQDTADGLWADGAGSRVAMWMTRIGMGDDCAEMEGGTKISVGEATEEVEQRLGVSRSDGYTEEFDSPGSSSGFGQGGWLSDT